MHTFTCVCESQRCFFSPLLSLKYITYSFFCLSALSLFSLCLLPCLLFAPLLHSPGARPSVSLSPPSLRLSSRCLLLLCVPWLPCVSCCVPFPVACSVLSSVCSSHLARPRSSPAAFCVSCRVSCCLSVTRQLSGARQCDSVGRCSACMPPAFCPLVYVLPCVPCLVLLPAACPCACPAAVCRLVVTIAYTPLYPGRRRCGAVSAM